MKNIHVLPTDKPSRLFYNKVLIIDASNKHNLICDEIKPNNVLNEPYCIAVNHKLNHLYISYYKANKIYVYNLNRKFKLVNIFFF